MNDDEKHLELIEGLFLKMGSTEKQSRIMAAQLLKRAQQIADEREMTLVEAVEGLLKQIVEAGSE